MQLDADGQLVNVLGGLPFSRLTGLAIGPDAGYLVSNTLVSANGYFIDRGSSEARCGRGIRCSRQAVGDSNHPCSLDRAISMRPVLVRGKL